ncbi:hypothetical protein Vi05172_g7129 [Venturia inaequalis]|nr:hypothetical protein Vi05172_g7129 [Venturia inaequalis]
MKFFSLRMKGKSNKAIKPQHEDQINKIATPLEDTPDSSPSPGERSILSSQLEPFHLISSDPAEDQSYDEPFEHPLRRGRDNLSYYEPDIEATPSPSPGMYQCE